MGVDGGLCNITTAKGQKETGLSHGVFACNMRRSGLCIEVSDPLVLRYVVLVSGHCRAIVAFFLSARLRITGGRRRFFQSQERANR